MTDIGPCRPAAAYYEMAELVGDSYFLLPVPQRGKVLIVQGTDGVTTEWHLTAAHALEVSEKIRDNPHLRLVASRRYPASDSA